MISRIMNQESLTLEERSRRRFRRNAAILCIVVLSFFSLPTLCSSHSHEDHDHHHHEHDVNPSFKYSRQANEEFTPPVKKQHHQHEHSHDHHGHDHGHHHHEHHHHEVPKSKKASEPLGKFFDRKITVFLLLSSGNFTFINISSESSELRE